MYEFLLVTETFYDGKKRQPLKDYKTEHRDHRGAYQPRGRALYVRNEVFDSEVLAHIRDGNDAHHGENNENDRPKKFVFYVCGSCGLRNVFLFILHSTEPPFS